MPPGRVQGTGPLAAQGSELQPRAPLSDQAIRKAARGPFRQSAPAVAQHPRARPAPRLPYGGRFRRQGGVGGARGRFSAPGGRRSRLGGVVLLGGRILCSGGPFRAHRLGFPTMAMAWEVRLADGRCADTSRVYPLHRWGGLSTLRRAPATSRVTRQVPAFRSLSILASIIM